MQSAKFMVDSKKGTFRYDAAKNVLVEINKKDLRKLAAPRFSAPLTLIIASDTAKQGRMKTMDKRIHYSDVDSGYVSQNIYLSATAQKLGTCAMRMIVDRKVLQEKMALGKNLLVLVHPIGTPAK